MVTTNTKELLGKPAENNQLLPNKNSKPSLSEREILLMEMFSQGRTIAQMAEAVKFSPRTVEFYIRNAEAKLDNQ
jgi:DNA-binding CsgD family transcriptional regulator